MRIPVIRPMVSADAGPAADLILANGWGDRRAWFELAPGLPEARPVVAELDGQVVGTGVGSIHGNVGWVGTIFVAPDLRRRGLGRALTEAVIGALEGAGCRTQVLVSTADGLPLYEALGFEHQVDYRILEVPGLSRAATVADPDPSGTIVRAFAPSDLPGMSALDAAATGEHRAHLLGRFATRDTAKVLADADGTIRGFVVRAPWGGGATIAPEAGDAMRILDARRRSAGPDGRVRVGILDSNEAGLATLEAAGLAPVWSAPRLIRGHPMAWRPEWIWGQFNHAIG
jgi:GNAT superfamily N-acetyltransferase